MNDANGGIGVLDGTAYPVGSGPASTAFAVDPALAPDAPLSMEPTLESRLFDGGFISGDQLDEILREQALSGRPAEEIVRERGFVAPGVVDRLLGRVPPPAIGSFELAPPAAPPAIEAPSVPPLAFEPFAAERSPAVPEPALEEPRSPGPAIAFDLVVTLRAGTTLSAAHETFADAQAAARAVVGAGVGEWLELGAVFVRADDAVAVEIRPRLLR